jgi:hypothetical protein
MSLRIIATPRVGEVGKGADGRAPTSRRPVQGVGASSTRAAVHSGAWPLSAHDTSDTAGVHRDPAPSAPGGFVVPRDNFDPRGTRSHRGRGRPGRTNALDSLTFEVLRTKRGRSHSNLRADSFLPSSLARERVSPGEAARIADDEALLTPACPRSVPMVCTVGYGDTTEQRGWTSIAHPAGAR